MFNGWCKSIHKCNLWYFFQIQTVATQVVDDVFAAVAESHNLSKLLNKPLTDEVSSITESLKEEFGCKVKC